MSQFLTAVLRTVIPSLWGSFVTWAVLLLPALAPLQDYLLSQSDVITTAATSAITAVVIGAWYAAWRWLQPKLPAWLVRAALGSSKTPIYSSTVSVNPSSATSTEAARVASQSLDRVDGPDHRA
ncbi:hypothetical protein [Pseudarthrobacter sp. LT1]|uniref:hypothetical protein n=1 Tax=Pseudarthrobacter sp. LT1 TaxID=3111450 RepID=UPI002D79458A|nr:hypothetical protein [Pseudarthrobacter sp. LT1]WRT14646.1 hypothetical protein VIK36_03900 [Pseudarthrobacter sp. LT1]